jgi:hypothetical protein
MDHFLDSNILLSRLLLNHPECKRTRAYFLKDDYRRHISHNVYRECKKVIDRYDEVSSKFLERIKSEPYHFDNSITESKRRTDCAKWVKNAFLKEYIQNDFDAFLKNKFPRYEYDFYKSLYVDALTNFVDYNIDGIVNVLLRECSPQKYCDLVEETIERDKWRLKELSIDNTSIKKNDTPARRLKDYGQVYPNIYPRVSDLISNKNDILLLLDSYYLIDNGEIVYIIDGKNIKCKDIIFLTRDKGDILSNKGVFERYLDGVHIDPLIKYCK